MVLIVYLLLVNQLIPEAVSADPLLTVQITGFESTTGDVRLAVFDSEDGFPRDPEQAIYTENRPVDAFAVIFSIEALEPGTYAITVFHDEDGDGELDMKFYGPPSEKVGSSNDARGMMGPPSFEDASFELGSEPLVMTITL
ncbi:MAG: DUF2141 domain-containing protein [Candidatus Sabulitectum sp.]|nr:DUF2141 domain-containing protein [Candidatus Sabulitectum sp.]